MYPSYNSIIYSSLNANAYPAIVAPMDFVSNSSIPTSFYEEQTCWPNDVFSWSITDLRSGIMDGSFEYLSKDECIDAYANSFMSSRRTVVLVTQGPITGAGISLAGYDHPHCSFSSKEVKEPKVMSSMLNTSVAYNSTCFRPLLKIFNTTMANIGMHCIFLYL